LNQGYIPQELSFIWRDLIQFNLNEKLSFKRVTALPELQEQIDANDIEAEDELTNLLLIGHTYQQLLDDMMACFTSSEVLEPA
jgi:DNA recombination-dependent growth factor C